MVAKGKYFFEVIDKGGLIIMAKRGSLIDTLDYSLDSGKTFKQLKFTDTKIEIFAITVHEN